MQQQQYAVQPIKKTAPSLKLFRPFIKRTETGLLIDASGVMSRECYLAWLQAKNVHENDEEAKRFLRTLTNHVSGTVSPCC